MNRPVMMFALALALSCCGAIASAGVKIITRDGGGRLDTRSQEVLDMMQSGDRVEIHTGYCNSACTLYLKMPTTCVMRGARLGFHGPRKSSFSKGPMTQDQFEHWTTWMSSHYPPAIRDWFLADARYVTQGYKYLSGSELIRHGIKECAN